MGSLYRSRHEFVFVFRSGKDQFRQLPEVLGGGCEEELIAGTIRSS